MNIISDIDLKLSKEKEITRMGQSWKIKNSLLYRNFWDNDDWEVSTYSALKKYLSPYESYIDIGAWVGPTALFASTISRHTYALEPDPIAFKYLRNNIEINHSDRVTALNYCMGKFDGWDELGFKTIPGDSESSMVIKDGMKRLQVLSITFNTLLKKFAIDDCGVIKMDIEGGEYSLLPTMFDYIHAKSPIIILSLHPHNSFELKGDFSVIEKLVCEYDEIFTISGNSIDTHILHDLHMNRLPHEIILKN